MFWLWLQLLAAPEISFHPTSFAFHAVASDFDLWTIQRKGRNLDESGRWTMHPGFGLGLSTPQWQASALYFRNSVDDHSGSVMMGPQWWIRPWWSLGIVGGAYIREPLPHMQFPLSLKTSAAEIAPLVFLTTAFGIKIGPRWGAELKIASNYVLSFFSPVLTYRF
jgi:hypothetical protein